MYVRIYDVKSVGKYADSIHANLQGIPVSLYVNAVGKSANNKNIGICLLQILDEMADYVLSIDRTLTSAYDANNL